MRNEIAAEKVMHVLPAFIGAFVRPINNAISEVISPMHYVLLHRIYYEGTITMSETCKTLHVSKQHASQIVNILIENNYAVRSVNQKDRRVINVTITEQGIQKIKEVNASLKRMYERYLNLFDEKQIEDTIKLLDKSKELLDCLSARVENNVCFKKK